MDKMSLKQGFYGEDMMHFQDLCASPAKSDASSVDIYDGLDSESLAEKTAEKSSPLRDCLDLYEEILTEEGTAKEASFNDLSAEYEKCQRQMKQLITKLKEMQSMNSSLQNENQCLKKNISALIKTARVEITRKEEEINRLNERLGAPGKNHSLKTNPLLLLSINKPKSSSDDLLKDVGNTESLPKKSVCAQSKAMTNHYSKNFCDKAKTCKESSQTCTSMNSNIKQCKESTEHCSQEQALQPRSLQLYDKKEKVFDSQNKDTERNRTNEKHKSSVTGSVSEISDLREKSCQSLVKCGKNESSNDYRNSKSEVSCETENRKYHSSSNKDKTHTNEMDHSKEKQVKKYERSPHRRESRVYVKEKNNESRHRTAEKNEDPRRSKRTHFSTPKDDGSRKLLELNDVKRNSDAGRRDKRSSECNESKHGNKDSKLSKSENLESNKPIREHKTERYDRERRDEKKRSREEDRSRHDRKDKGQHVKEKDVQQSSSKEKGLHSKVSEKSKNKDSKELDGTQKDLKLSFMETLNLTLSPVKKTSDTQHEASIASNMKGDVEENVPEDSSQLCEIKNNMDPLHSKQIELRQSEPASIDGFTTKVLNKEYSKLVPHSEPAIDTIACLDEEPPNSAVDESTELLTKLTVEDQPDRFTVLDTVSSEEMDTQCLEDGSDFLNLDSFIEIDRCSGSPTPENPNSSLPAEQNKDGSIISHNEEANDKAITLTSNLAEAKGICESQDNVFVSSKEVENKHCILDESSIDLNFIRHIPKVLSPLKSPIRPKVHLGKVERNAKASVVSILHKELPPETDAKSTCLSVSEELNKENCQPDKSEFGCKVASSEGEVEEGEVLSEEEEIIKEASKLTSSPSQLVPDQVISMTKSQSSHDDELPLSKPDPLFLPQEKPASKKEPKIDKQSKVSACPSSRGRKLNADSCLDGITIVKIPSSIQDVLQMLQMIREHIRRKYMKFKVQFSLAQFHRIIEEATLCFITLVRNLDWTALCSSTEILQKKLCRHIETRLKKLKSNGIVDRIFEQHLIDMKKRLWKFVNEQLDSLFDMLKAVILKLCSKAEVEKDTASGINTQKTSDPVNSSQNERNEFKDKVGLPSSGEVPCLRRLEFTSQPKVSNPKLQNDTDKAVQIKLAKEIKGIDLNLKNVDNPSSNFSQTLNHPHQSPTKTVSNEPCPKRHLSSSGLSFNLVSDDHMGDIFKSLLENSDTLPQTSDNLALNTIPESMWILATPEKNVSSNQKFDSVNSPAENKTPRKAIFPWSSISPPHLHSFPGLESVLNPDVFDESCLLEIPTSASSSKSLNGSDDRLKSYSVLLEDLAVSLTVPSPLKSDSHLSFLRPVCDAESISEVEVKCHEGLVVDEEDATEQDIHLTLDSDNSSIGSLEDIGETGSFQYHPSEPMQAVIMEKSNDHFIVKIRRAVSSSSPVSDCSTEGRASAALESEKSVEGNKLKVDSKLETESETHSGSLLLHADHIDLANVTENCVACKRSEEVPLKIQESTYEFKLPPSKSQHLETPAESKLHATDIVEHSEVDCQQNATSCIEETCSQGSPDDLLLMKTSVSTVNLKKKRKSIDNEQSAKRQKCLSRDCDQSRKHNKTKELEKPNKKKHKTAVRHGSVNVHFSTVSPTSLSAKNVIKKKGEVIVSWTRDEDRAILLECQKLGPTRKTFLLLSSSMNKYPHQVEERFRQLMKLFKKSRNCSS